MQHAATRSLLIACLLVGLATAPLASAGESHGYPQTTNSNSSFSQSSVSYASEEVDGGAWTHKGYRRYGKASDLYASRERSERYGSERAHDERWGDERYSDERYADEGSAPEYYGHDQRVIDQDVVYDDEVGYLPVSFFGDAGGVGPFAVDYGYDGGGGGFAYGGGFASGFAGASAHASASASASISIIGGLRGGLHGGGGMHGGYPPHGGGGHGCGCK